jgi:ribosomal protein RSM22 (predicted rRNA methylase)
MVSPSLPAELRAALDAKLEGLARLDVAARAAAISMTYREGGNSGTIASETDALAYALARMPATYAAVAASLNALKEIRPDFAPQSLLDIGAGPGTASWAAAGAFSTLASFTQLDANPALRALALEFARDSSRPGIANYALGPAGASLGQAGDADLVIASYLIGELGERERRDLVDAMWAKTCDTLVIVEPGTPAGYARIIAARAQLIASGAHVAAPCPHDRKCPLQSPDWCHFAQHLPRSRAHMQMKDAEVPFEDEKFSYVVLTRTPVAKRPSRVLAPPVAGKAEITAKLCTPDGVTFAKVPRRDKPAYARARRWSWGDSVEKS